MSEIGTDSDLYSDTEFGADRCESICATSAATSAAGFSRYTDEIDETGSVFVGRKYSEGGGVLSGGRQSLVNDKSASLSFGSKNRVGTPGVAVGARQPTKTNPLSVVSSRASSLAGTPSLSDSDSIDEERVDMRQTLTFKNNNHNFLIKTFRDIRGANHHRQGPDGSCVLLGVGLDGLGSAYAVAKFPIAENDGDMKTGVSSDGHLAPTVVRILRQRIQAVAKMSKTRNVLPHYGATLHKGALYCAAHYANGGSLADFAARNRRGNPCVRVGEDFARLVLRHVLRGVMRIHEAGLVHGAIGVRNVYFDIATAHKQIAEDDDDENTAIIAMLGGFADYILEHRIPSVSNSPSFTPRPDVKGKVALDESPSWASKKSSNGSSPRQGTLHGGRSPQHSPHGLRTASAVPATFLNGSLATLAAHGGLSPMQTSIGNTTPLSGSFMSMYDDSDTQASALVSQLAKALADDLHAVLRLADAMFEGFTAEGPYNDSGAASVESDMCPVVRSKFATEFLDELADVADQVASLTGTSVLSAKHRSSLGVKSSTTREVLQAMFAASAQSIKTNLVNHRFLVTKRNGNAASTTTAKAKSNHNAAQQYLIADAANEVETYANTQRKTVALDCVGERTAAKGGGGGSGRTTSFRLGSSSNLTAGPKLATSATKKTVAPTPSVPPQQQQPPSMMQRIMPVSSIQSTSPNVSASSSAVKAPYRAVEPVGQQQQQPVTARRVVPASVSGPNTGRRGLQQL